MTSVLTLLLAHLIGDFPLQTNKVFQLKSQGSLGLALHVAIHLIVTALLIRHPWQYGGVFAILGIAHFITDWVKLKYPGQNQTAGFVWDQLIHYITILLVGYWQPDLPTILPNWVMVPALITAFIPAIMTFLWVWAIQIQQKDTSREYAYVTWASRALLPLSQRLGLAVIAFITLASSTFLL